MNRRCYISAGIFLFAMNIVLAHEQETTAHYLANEGVMVVRGDTKIIFDPLFRNSYGRYELLPKEMEAALFAGMPPYDGVDAVFISHNHSDHFSPKDILKLLRALPHIRLYAPQQAVEGLRKVAVAEDMQLFTRVNSIGLAYKDAPLEMEMQGLKILAVRIPHSGWPKDLLDLENIAFRVTLDDAVTVLHLGDADPNDVHFARDAGHWDARQINLALPPYWFYISTYGPDVLNNRLKPDHSVGIHIPEGMLDDPSERSAVFEGIDLFTEPGETRAIQHNHD